MVKIITDSTCDLTLEELEQLDVEMLSLRVNFGKEEFLDKRTITNEEFYEKLEKSNDLPTTTLISIGEFQEAFERYPNEEIVVLPISTGLSGTYQSAMMAKEMSDRKDIYVVETGGATLCLGLLVRQAVLMSRQGMSAQEIAEKIKALSKRVKLYAVIDTLKYLVKGGRLTGVQGAFGEMLNIKPIITIEEGLVKNIGKARGAKAARSKLIELVTQESQIDWEMPVAFAHTNNTVLMNELMKELNQEDNPETHMIGSVVGTHAGPGAVAVIFFEKE